MKLLRCTAIALVAFGAGLFTVHHAAAASYASYTCTGGTIPAGTYGSLYVRGPCQPASGDSTFYGNITVGNARPGTTAEFDASSQVPDFEVYGSVLVLTNSIALIGCRPPPQGSCSAYGGAYISGSVSSRAALAVILVDNEIEGGVSLGGGGGGVNCNSNALLGGSPLYSDVTDNYIAGNVVISGLQTCWFGVIDNYVDGNTTVSYNRSADPDSTEIASNYFNGNLSCFNNSPPAQLGDSGGSPNYVGGTASGECAGLGGGGP